MRVSITQIFYTFVLAGVLIVAMSDLEIGFAMAAAVLPVLFYALLGARRNSEFGMVLFAAAGFVWVVYLVHPVLLISFPDFPVLFSSYVPREEHIPVLFKISIFNLALLSGIWVGLYKAKRKNFVSRKEILLRIETVVIMLLVFMLIIRVLESIYDPHGVGGITIFGYLQKLLPFNFFLPLIIVYAFDPIIKKRTRYRKIYYFLLFCWPLIILIGGSKGALFFLFLYLMLFSLLIKPNWKMKLIPIFTIIFVSSFLAVTSFQIGRAFSLAAKYEFNLGAISSVKKQVESRFGEMSGMIFLYQLNEVASRLIGYQGMLAVNRDIPAYFKKIAGPVGVLEESIASIIPGIQYDKMTAGKAVSVLYLGLPQEREHGASLGLFASVYVMGGSIGGAFILAGIGFLYGVIIRLIRKISPSEGIRKVFTMLAMYLFLHLLIGNIAARIGVTYFIGIQALFYGTFLWFIVQGASSSLSPPKAHAKY